MLLWQPRSETCSSRLSERSRRNCNQGLDITDPQIMGAKGAEVCSRALLIHTSLVLDLQTNSPVLCPVDVLGLTLFGQRLIMVLSVNV